MKTLFKYNQEKLLFERTNTLLKYRVVVVLLIILLSFTLFSAIKNKKELNNKEVIIKEKDKRIKFIQTPLRKENYVEDLYTSIGFNLTKEQYKRFSELALKYRNQIEISKVPATLVWWTAYNESRFDVNSKNSKSTASGMYQFLSGTWNEVCKMKGYNIEGRFDEQKQVTLMLDYLNYLYARHGSWDKSVSEFHGGSYHYPVKFLFK